MAVPSLCTYAEPTVILVLANGIEVWSELGHEDKIMSSFTMS